MQDQGVNRLEKIEILTPGQRLREIRRKLGVRQEDLAGKNLSKNYISMFENDKRRISIINATYLSQNINEIAKEKGLDFRVASNYFIKSEIDIVKDKCLEWLEQCKKSEVNDNYRVYSNIYGAIFLAEKYELLDILADSYFLKGCYLYNNKLYSCAIIHFSQSLFYYTKNGEIEREGNCYLNMAKVYYKMEYYDLAISYFNLAGATKKIDKEEISYYKALSFYKLKEYRLAKSTIDNILLRDGKTLELENSISKKLTKDEKKTM